MQIQRGDTVQGHRWPEPVEVNHVEHVGDYIRLIGVTLHSRQHIDQLIHPDEISTLKVSKLTTSFTAPPTDIFLCLEAKRYRYASLYDPLLAMNTSKIEPLPHQIEAVYGYVLRLPRIRFLIADDPGAGKTIMAGLIIKELKLRQLVSRILIVVPGHLKDQWRRELRERFEERFTIIDRSFLDAFYAENAWEREAQIITSIDFAKQDSVISSLSSSHFDLVIVDEAHKMSAYQYGDKLTKTGRYKLGEILSQISEHLLFLTATPHKGDPENFRLFLDLLEPGFFATAEMLYESILQKDNPLFIRRIKEDLKDFDGKPLFLPRHVRTLSFDLGKNSPHEKDIYNELSKYVNTQYNKALTRDKKRNVAFALVILQRRFASSMYALLRSLERRKKRLLELLEGPQEPPKHAQDFDFEEIEDLSEADRWKEEEIWETLSVAENREELLKEIETLERLSQMARDVIGNEGELKLRELKDTITKLDTKFPGEKIIIFTESRDTLEYLQKRIVSWGHTVSTIHGGMRLEERIETEKIFKNDTQILVATEAAGEGINLQFCHLMINYDIPWNPNRLEQRMGRIHRYGQTKEVYIFNLVAEDTREGKVLKRVFEKIDEIKNALGSDKVFDVLSEVIRGKNLATLLVEAAANTRNIDEILSEIEIDVDEKYVASVKEKLGESLATHYIDFTSIKEMADRAREYRLIPEYTQAFFETAFSLAGGKYKTRKDGFINIQTVPMVIRDIAREDTFKKSFGTLLRKYPKVTFDKEIAFKTSDAEFISFGHPLFEATLEWVEQSLSEKLKIGGTFEDPDGIMDGFAVFYEGEIKDGRGNVAGKRLFPFFVDRESGEVKYLNPAFVWDLARDNTIQSPQTFSQDNIEQLRKKVLNALIPELEKYKESLAQERKRQASIKEKYGIKSLEHLIIKLDGDLIKLYDRRARGEKVELVIGNKEEQKKRYEKALVTLKQTIKQEQVLTMSNPSCIGAIRVVPAQKFEPGMKKDLDIELVGMNIAMEFERENGREPEDVSSENLGFDIRSTDKHGRKRYIEVKARAHKGSVALTQNEWFKAKRFGDDYYLYVIMDAASEPRLHIIRNPAKVLLPEMKIENVRYVVDADQILKESYSN